MKIHFPFFGRRAGAVLALMASVAVARAESLADAVGNRTPALILRTMPSDTPAEQQLAGLKFVAGFEVIGEPVAIPAEDATRLAALIKDSSAFDDTEPEAKMRPGVAFRFGNETDFIDLLVCFSCDKVAVAPAGSATFTLTKHLTQPAREVLLGISKKLLPHDEAIQELPKVRSKNPVPPPAAPVPEDAPRPGKPAGTEN